MARYVFPMGIVATLVGMSVFLVPILLPRNPWGTPVSVSLDSPRVLDRSASPVPEAQVLVALAPVRSPRTSYLSWRQFTDYLGRKLSLTVGLEPCESSKDVEALLREGKVDFAFICSGTYVRARRKGPITPLVVPSVRGSVTNNALLIVRKDSPYRSLDDLSGRSFAFTDSDSTYGSLMPRFQLRQRGADPESHFSETIYTHSHDLPRQTTVGIS